MKILHLVIISLIVVSCMMVASQAYAIPYMSPQDLYKQSDMVFYGQVISKQIGPGSDYYYYQVKVETYFKNPQNSDSITVAGHKSSSVHMTYPQFEIGDKAIFYITQLEGINTISPYSQKAGGACDIHSFLGPGLLPGEQAAPAAAGLPLELTEINGTRVGHIPPNTQIVVNYNAWNNSPETKNFTIEISIQKENDTVPVFYKKQVIEIQACDEHSQLSWNFVPTKMGYYIVNATVDGKLMYDTGFEVTNPSSSVTNSQLILSPLKQFKSGIDPYHVTCRQDLQLIIKSKNNSPACVKSTSLVRLLEQGWVNAYNRNENYNNNILQNSIVNPTSALKLYLSTNSSSMQSGQAIGIDISLNNTSSQQQTLPVQNNWPINGLGSGGCSFLPIGITILDGYYTEQNMTDKKSLSFYFLPPCAPFNVSFKSYAFQPMSSKVITECESTNSYVFSCPQMIEMRYDVAYSHVLENGDFHPFNPGLYTIIGGDEWGHIVIQHFAVTNSTKH